jgi:hypothetical protein
MGKKEENNNVRKSLFNRVYCYNCGSPWDQEEVICQKCGSTQDSNMIARPVLKTEEDYERYSGPWSMIPWPPQGSVCIFGGAGTGKSSISSLIRPKWWITKEQEPKPASHMFNRLTPGWMPKIAAVDDADEVDELLRDLRHGDGPIVVDSLTAFGLKDSLRIAHAIVNWTRGNNERSLSILQATHQGTAAGYTEIPHLFDAVINTSIDPWGVRCFRIKKSRWSGLENSYYTFDDKGQIVSPSFDAAYTVEGSAGEYFLHPYPVKGAKWSGIAEALANNNALTPKMASAAQVATYMPSGFVEPMDHIERKRFAERAGLEWISPEDVYDLINDENN